jgi:hypothetical protein
VVQKQAIADCNMMLFHTRQVDIGRKTDNSKCWQGSEKAGTLTSSYGNVKWHSHFGEQLVVPQKSNTQLPYDSGISLLGPFSR